MHEVYILEVYLNTDGRTDRHCHTLGSCDYCVTVSVPFWLRQECKESLCVSVCPSVRDKVVQSSQSSPLGQRTIRENAESPQSIKIRVIQSEPVNTVSCCIEWCRKKIKHKKLSICAKREDCYFIAIICTYSCLNFLSLNND